MPTFRNTEQHAEVCVALLRRANLVALWGATGPTPKARHLLTEPSALSARERIFLLLAFDVWEALGSVLVIELLEDISIEDVDFVCNVLAAVRRGPMSVDAWLAANDGSDKVVTVPIPGTPP